MTTREEIKAKLDILGDAEVRQIAELIDAQQSKHKSEAAELARLLDILSEPLPEDEQRELLADLERKPWRTPLGEDAS